MKYEQEKINYTNLISLINLYCVVFFIIFIYEESYQLRGKMENKKSAKRVLPNIFTIKHIGI